MLEVKAYRVQLADGKYAYSEDKKEAQQAVDKLKKIDIILTSLPTDNHGVVQVFLMHTEDSQQRNNISNTGPEIFSRGQLERL